MIRNERQYQAARAHRRRLLETRAGYEAAPQADPLAQAGLLSSVDWLLQDVEAEVAEYEALRAGALHEGEAEGLGAVPDLLVKARIAGGLTQRQLAERLGVAEEAVQRDEAGATRARAWTAWPGSPRRSGCGCASPAPSAPPTSRRTRLLMLPHHREQVAGGLSWQVNLSVAILWLS